MVSEGGEVVRSSGVGEGVSGRQVRRSPESKQKKSSDWKPLVPLKDLPLQQVDDRSVTGGLFQNITWNTVLLVQNPGGPSLAQITFLKYFKF